MLLTSGTYHTETRHGAGNPIDTVLQNIYLKKKQNPSLVAFYAAWKQNGPVYARKQTALDRG